jgi:hypothetical protein
MISTALYPLQSVSNSLIPVWQTIGIFFVLQSMWKMVYVAQIQHRESQKQLMNGHRPLYFLAEVIPQSILIQLYYWVINRGRYTDGFYNCMIDDKDSHLHLPLIMFTCTVSRHAVLVRHKINGVPPKASMAKLKVDRPDRSNYINYENDSGKNAHCRTAMGRKL